MTFDPASLFFSLLISSVGVGLFLYGKKEARWPQLIVGLAMMVYPYFTATFSALVGVGLLLSVALWWTLRMGW